MSRIGLQGWPCRRTSQPNELISFELAINIISLIMNWFIARIPEDTRNEQMLLFCLRNRSKFIIISPLCSLTMLAEFIMSNVGLSWADMRRQRFIVVMPPGTVKTKVLKTDHSCHRRNS